MQLMSVGVSAATALDASQLERPWQQYGSGKYIIGDSKMPPGVTVYNVASSLAKINRFTGHSKEPISVARHSIYVANQLGVSPSTALLALYGLVHDVPETVVNDLSAPLKAALGPEGLAAYKAIEDAAEEALYALMHVPWPVPADIRPLVKRADIQAVMAEKDALMPECDSQWKYWKDISAGPLAKRTYDWRTDRDDWLTLFDTLSVWISNGQISHSRNGRISHSRNA